MAKAPCLSINYPAKIMYELKTRGGAGDIFVFRFVAAADNAHDFDSFLHGVTAFLRACEIRRNAGMSRSIILEVSFPTILTCGRRPFRSPRLATRHAGFRPACG